MERESINNYQPFVYPAQTHIRRHGPCGYTDYQSYRDWLRDEFTFRCVFCLKREKWGTMTGAWHIDHFVPQSICPEGKVDYDNLLYICCSCNSVKSDALVPDPCSMAFGDCLLVEQNGNVKALNDDGEILIEVLRLNNKGNQTWRHLIISTLYSLAVCGQTEILKLWLSYPMDNLPDLSNRIPPNGNTKPEGVNNSYYALYSRGQLPDMY